MKFKGASNLNHKLIALLLSLFFLIQCVQKSVDRAPSSVPLAKTAPSSSAKPEFEICHSRSKLYLEDQILRMPAEYVADHSEDWTKKIPIQCIQFAQKNFKGSFAYCNNEDEKPKVGAPRPCLTENYTRLVYNAYHDVKDCFNLDPKSSFLQIMIESGFHINAINRTGFDAGVAQMTKNGMLRVTERDLVEKTRRVLLESNSPSCQRIASTVGKLDADAFSINKRCSMMSLPENPYRGFLLHYLHALRDQIFFKQQLVKLRPEIESILTPQMVEQFVYFAYNRGITGTLRLIDGYYKNRKAAGQVVKSSDFVTWQNLRDIRSTMRREPAMREQLKKSKIKKLSFMEYAIIQNQPYMANMAEARDMVKRHLQNRCIE
ncbi:hypothetical protein [Pseudobdellovibrio sp. HCB154]|uniref:hypothetical protein n=1 Tax=Pseudobdellovibrio sp. HCB154 TaxID=3386277 RepID=UPI0039175140